MTELPKQPDAAGKQINRKRRILLWIFYIFIFLLITGIGISLYFLHLAKSNATYWQTTDTSQPQVQKLAVNLQNRLPSQLHDTHQGDWQLELTQDEINAWLSYRLPMWIENQQLQDEWLGQAKNINVHISEDGLRIMFIPPDSEVQTTLLLTPQKDENGNWELYLTSIQAGRLIIPRSFVLPSLAEKRMDDILSEMYVEVRDTPNDDEQALKDKLIEQHGSWPEVEAEAKRRAIKSMKHIPLVLPLDLLGLDKNRTVKVIGCQFTNGKIILTCRTEQN